MYPMVMYIRIYMYVAGSTEVDDQSSLHNYKCLCSYDALLINSYLRSRSLSVSTLQWAAN